MRAILTDRKVKSKKVKGKEKSKGKSKKAKVWTRLAGVNYKLKMVSSLLLPFYFYLLTFTACA
ncbi:MAG: hypothetical protein AUG51_03935 [Acidobacteria bacterium 13_1_20CM_3_53_8]|nr:MAG: hypothetical protein AUG51_03935 [Acidobacteria bacterium 13_1_20CM_3_53_8]